MFEFLSDMHQRFRLSRATERLEGVPQGDGRGIIVIPGHTASDFHTVNLRLFLNEIGYNAYGWNCGVNTGFNYGWIDKVVDTAWLCRNGTKQKVSLIGWSLGAAQACILAAEYTNLFDKVISIGGMLKGLGADEVPDKTYSIYSKDDPVVRWTDSVIDGIESHEVSGGHWALMNNPDVYEAVAKFLVGGSKA
jgi:pimeloyl-ACP methyl ester carboxylesterase